MTSKFFIYLFCATIPVISLVSCVADEPVTQKELTTTRSDEKKDKDSDTEGCSFDMSKHTVKLDFFTNTPGAEADTILFGETDWNITQILFDKNQRLHIFNQSNSTPYHMECEWLVMDWNGKELIISTTVGNNNEYAFYDSDWPKYRVANIILEHAEGVDTLKCIQMSELPLGRDFSIGPKPNQIIFQPEGGTVTTQTWRSGWIFKYVVVDGIRHNYTSENSNQDFSYNFIPPFPEFKSKLNWLTIERKGTDNPNEIVLTVDPNPTDSIRTFTISIGHWGTLGQIVGWQLSN